MQQRQPMFCFLSFLKEILSETLTWRIYDIASYICMYLRKEIHKRLFFSSFKFQ